MVGIRDLTSWVRSTELAVEAARARRGDSLGGAPDFSPRLAAPSGGW